VLQAGLSCGNMHWNVVWALFLIKQILKRKHKSLTKKYGLIEVEIRITFICIFVFQKFLVKNENLLSPSFATKTWR
jgi:hypothetical protein